MCDKDACWGGGSCDNTLTPGDGEDGGETRSPWGRGGWRVRHAQPHGRLQVQGAAFEQWHVTGVLAMCGQIVELSQDHPVALILSQTVRACLFPLPPFLPPIILFNRIMTLIVKQSLSSLVFKSHPGEPCYWCSRLSM